MTRSHWLPLPQFSRSSPGDTGVAASLALVWFSTLVSTRKLWPLIMILNIASLQNQLQNPTLGTLKNLMRSLTAWLENDYCSITVANHWLITIIRFVAKSYTHSLKKFGPCPAASWCARSDADRAGPPVAAALRCMVHAVWRWPRSRSGLQGHPWFVSMSRSMQLSAVRCWSRMHVQGIQRGPRAGSTVYSFFPDGPEQLAPVRLGPTD